MKRGKGRKTIHAKRKLGLPDLEQAKSAVLASLRSLNRSAAIATQSTNLFSGIARSLACLSTRRPSLATESTLKSGNWLLVR
jgi:hypothetical protein